MSYVPGAYDGGPLESYLQQELQRISEVIIPVVDGEILKRHVAPEHPRFGLFYADGIDWDPGNGEGIYVYDEDSTAFEFVGGAGAGAGVDSFDGRTGAVVPILADYNSFFLTPAEGNAAYSLLGHGHIAADVSDFDTEVSNNASVVANTAKVTNATHTGDATGATLLTIAADAVTYAKMQNVVADERLLGNIAGAGGIVTELTPTQVRTMINVESGATADQTAAEIEAIVNHDSLLGFVANEHLRWDLDLGSTNLHANNSANNVLALTSGEVAQLANIGGTVISVSDWTAVAALIGTNTGDQTITLTGDVTGSGTGSFATIVVEANVNHNLLANFVAQEHIRWDLTGSENLATDRSANAVLALAAGEVTQLANIGGTVISAADWIAVAALLGTNTGDEPTASTTVQGIVERATQAEVDSGTDTTRYVSPSTLENKPGGVSPVIKHKTGDTPRTNNTLSDDPHLVGWSLVADKYYSIEGYLAYFQNTGDIKVRFALTNAAQLSSYSMTAIAAGNTSEHDMASSITGTEVISGLTDDQEAGIRMTGFFQANATTGGTIDFQWAQRLTSGNATILREGSWIKIRQLD